jgi:four helix bundle protein
MIDRFSTLPIFQEAHALTLSIYKVTTKFPEEEKFGLISQIRRSASSVPTNIVEGNARGHEKEMIEFLYIAKGSLEETKYHLLLSRDLSYISEEDYTIIHDKADSVGKQLNGLINYWKKKA